MRRGMFSRPRSFRRIELDLDNGPVVHGRIAERVAFGNGTGDAGPEISEQPAHESRPLRLGADLPEAAAPHFPLRGTHQLFADPPVAELRRDGKARSFGLGR